MPNPANRQSDHLRIQRYYPGHPLYLSAMAQMRNVLDARAAIATTVRGIIPFTPRVSIAHRCQCHNFKPFEQWLQSQPVALEHYVAWRNEQILPRIREEPAEHRGYQVQERIEEGHVTSMPGGMMHTQDNTNTGPIHGTQDPPVTLEDIWRTIQEQDLPAARELTPEALLDLELDLLAIMEEGRRELDEYQGNTEPTVAASATEVMEDEDEITPRAIPLSLDNTAGEAVTGPE
jgi:hypothetical protein